MGIGAGSLVALITVVVGVVIWSMNVNSKVNNREHQNTRYLVDERQRETNEAIERLRKETNEAIERLRKETYESIERFRQETLQLFERSTEDNARQHRELANQIGFLYKHVHDDGSRAVIPADELDPAGAPSPAGN